MPAQRAQIAKSKPQGRSRVGNGRALLANVDGRSVAVRRLKEILAQLVSDMGGDPSEAQLIICRRASTLAVWCEQAEAGMANGKEIDISEFTTATNALRRLLTDIGLQRRAKDITPTLERYLTDTYSEAAR
ncbi:hypothetical protein N182_24800 [Sinorhizobium sp. GL2]|nr:hypothetical protein N182_24800 [Sinorhizobium sp. GL2]